MLQKLIIRNFQTHRHLKIEFDERVTTLVGQTEAGKTTVLRALRWLCLNKPSGNKSIKWGEDHVKVTLIADGIRIIRCKTAQRNSYKVGTNRYVAFGTSVPSTVSNVLAITETNFASQLEGPFWFNLTPGQVSKELNKIINLEKIDQTLARVATEVRRAKSEIDFTRTRLGEARQAKKELAWVNQAQQSLEAAEEAQNRLGVVSNSKAALADLLEQATLAHRSREKAMTALVGAERLAALAEPLLKQRSPALVMLIDEIYQTFNELVECEARLKLAEKKLAQVKTCPLCGSPLRTK